MTRAISTPKPRDWSARVLALLSAVGTALLFTQATLAGHMLTGQATALDLHGIIGTEVFLWVAAAQGIASIVWRLRAGPTAPLVTSALLFALITIQSMLGHDGRLAIHVPNALLILLGQLWLLRQSTRGGSRR